MKLLRIFLLPALLAPLFMACRTTTLLSATFENDVVGNQPEKNLSGDPVGDSLRFDAVSNVRLHVRNSATAGEKALEFAQAGSGPFTPWNQWLSFRAIQTDFTQPLWFFWTARRGARLNGNLLVYLTDGRAGVIAGFKIMENGQVYRLTALSGGQDVLLGTLPAQSLHSIIVSLRLAEGRYNVTLTGAPGRPITVSNLPVLLPILAYANPARPSIDFRYQEEFNEPARQYLFESVFITRKQPD